jgi:anti-anti-sigma factor
MAISSLLDLHEGQEGLSIHVNREGLRIEGEAALTESLFALARRRGQQRWILDLDGLDALSGSTLTDLLRLDRKLRHAGGRLSLRNLNPLLYDIFHICRLTELLDIEALV